MSDSAGTERSLPYACGGEDQRSLPGEIAVVACHFNPCRFASRRRNLERFLRGLRQSAIEPYFAEIAFDDDSFELPESERTIRFRTGHVLWHKERLLNLLVERLPAKYDKIVWVDADLLFERSDWLESTARLLERFPIVQPFERAVFLDERDRPVQAMHSLVRGIDAGRKKPNFARYHPGFAWAARREFFSRHGLFEFDICGGGDATFVAGAFGWRDRRAERLQGPTLTAAMQVWTAKVFDDVQARAACTPGAVALKGTTLEFKQDECQFVFMKCNEPTKYYFDSKGKFVSQTSAGGEETTTERDESGSPGVKTRSTSQNGQTVESFVESTYVASGANAGRLESQVYGRRLNPTLLVRRMVYAYYEPGEEHGNPGDLKTITEQYRVGSAWVDKHTAYYRYYKAGEPNGYESGMKYSLGYQAFARLVADPQVFDPLLATDAQVAAYADSYYEYDVQERVSKWTSRAGLLTNLYAYAESAFSDDRNHWKRKTVETRPDGSQRVTYYNYLQQTLLTELVSGSDSWIEYWSYDADGLEILHAHPSAVSGYDDSVADLDVALRPSSGMIEWTEYYASTTATETTPGGVEGYLKASGVQEGASGTHVKALERSYFARVVDDYSFFPVATSTVYRETNGTGAIETSYAYEWYPDSLQMKQRTTTLPVVPVSQNGTGAVETTTEVYDAYGYLHWTRDARGYIGYQEHDWVTGNLVREIQDVDGTKLTLPAGWSTPEGGGLHLVTDYEYDVLGRATQTLGPAHDVEGQSVRTASWTVYRDLVDETLSAQGYAAGLPEGYVYTLVNPVSISRESDDGLTGDSIAAVRGGKATACAGALREAGIVESPGRLSATDCFAQESWVRWSRSLSDKHGRQIADRVYHAIPECGEGKLGANYDETIYGYDAMARRNRVRNASGTIERTVFDVRGQALSIWIGTNDVGATDADPTGDSAPGNNLVVVSESVYDDGADGGDGNLTRSIADVDASTTRTTNYKYDFRNRRTVVDGEVDFWQETVYDNLGQTIRVDRRDTTSGGNLISRSETLFDDRGRTYRTIRYGVDPATGTVGESLVDNRYYDANGNVVESRPSGSATVTLSVYDGVGRQTASYVGYRSGESSSSSESDDSLLESLVVFEQSETEYDEAGNVLFQTSRQRWHNVTGTGPLQGPTGDGPKSRDTYQGMWYDGIGRAIASANYGTNGDAGPPASLNSPPDSSDDILVGRMNYDDRGEAFEMISASGRVSRSYTDDAGRSTLSIQNVVVFEDGLWQPGSEENVAVEQVYLAGGRLGEQIAHNPVTGPQAMRYEYGTTLVDSDLTSNDLLVAEIYPDSSASSDRVTYAYDRQSQRTTLTDQNGTTRNLEYDALGRKTADIVTTLGDGVDGAVRRIGWTYEVRGMVERVTSYSDAAGTSIENEIANVYNGFVQLVTQYQQHDGAVVTLASPKVQYDYADGSANTIRATSMIYPDGAVLDYRYDDEAADALSRVRTLRFDSVDVCRYDYLGIRTFVRTDYLEPQVRLDHAAGSGANPYAGFDRFGRVVDQLWRNYDSSADVVRIKHGYDRSSNRLYREDAVAASFGKAFDELYRYDGLDRLLDFARGNLVDGNTAIETPDWSQDWKLDAVGNWNGFEQRVANDPAKWLDQRRTTNRTNEITEISRTVGAEWTTPTYDANGNMASLPRWIDPATSYRPAWDAWNRLVRFEEPNGSGGWRDLQENAYDGTNRRILRKNYETGALSETRRYLYTDRWQAIEEGVFDGSAFDPERQYVYGQRYIDDVVLRDRDSDLGGSFDERFYAMQDANWNVVALCDAEAAVQRRYTYLPYGDDTGYEGDFAPYVGPNYLWTRRFASYEFDIDLELCLARRRWFDPRLGTWVSKDPIGYGTNVAQYVGANPIIMTDPQGLQQKKHCVQVEKTSAKLRAYLYLFRQGTYTLAPEIAEFEMDTKSFDFDPNKTTFAGENFQKFVRTLAGWALTTYGSAAAARLLSVLNLERLVPTLRSVYDLTDRFDIFIETESGVTVKFYDCCTGTPPSPGPDCKPFKTMTTKKDLNVVHDEWKNVATGDPWYLNKQARNTGSFEKELADLAQRMAQRINECAKNSMGNNCFTDDDPPKAAKPF